MPRAPLAELVRLTIRSQSSTRKSRGHTAAQDTVDAVSSNYAEYTNELRKRLATHVRILPQNDTERGTIEIEYYNETDLERLLELLGVL